MDQSDSPKRKPTDKHKSQEPEKPSPVRKVVEIASEVATDMLKTGEPPTLDHMAHLHGLGLLSELAKLGDDFIGSRQASEPAGDGPQPVNPRKQVKPRSQIKPR